MLIHTAWLIQKEVVKQVAIGALLVHCWYTAGAQRKVLLSVSSLIVSNPLHFYCQLVVTIVIHSFALLSFHEV
jgi:hypothetical protein